MKILTFILLFLAGCGLIAYSYIGGFMALAGELEQSRSAFEATSLMFETLEAIASGEYPQLAGFFYGGVLVIAFAVVRLFMKREGQ